jgi:hypothetical protein
MKASSVYSCSLLSAFLAIAGTVLVLRLKQAPGAWVQEALGGLRSMNEDTNRQNQEKTKRRPPWGDASRPIQQQRGLSPGFVVRENQGEDGVKDTRSLRTFNFSEEPTSQNYTNATQNETSTMPQSQAPVLESTKQNNTEPPVTEAVYAPAFNTNSLGPSPRPSPRTSPRPTSRRLSPTPSPQPTAPGPQLPVLNEGMGQLQYVGNDGTFFAAYPLGPCQGDCDTDDDWCVSSLGLYVVELLQRHHTLIAACVPQCRGSILPQ